MKRSDVFVAKALLLLGLSYLGTSWYFRGDPTVADEVSFFAMFAGATLVAMGLAGMYEGVSHALAWALARVRRLTVRGDPAEGGEVSVKGDVPGPDAGDPGQPRRYAAKEAGLTFLAYVVGSAVVWIVLGVWVGLFAAEATSVEELERAFLELAPRWFVWAAVVGAGTAAWTFHRLSPVPARRLPGVVGLGPRRVMAAAVVVGALANLGYLQLVPHLPVQPTRIPDSALWDLLFAPGASRWLVLLTAVTVAPLTEELVFRGLVFEGLARSWSTRWAVLGSAALFTLLHVPDTLHYWPAIVMIFLMGSLAGFARARTGHIGPAVGVHFGYNAVVAAMWLL